MMKIVEIIRLEEDFDHGTFGVLKIDKQVFCFTLEPADQQNKQNKSSIPAQQYICGKVTSQKYGETFEVMNVPNRKNILFHPGNVKDDTQGCILLGRYKGRLDKNRAILNSGDTFREFMDVIMAKEKLFHLTIHEFY